MKKKIRLLLIAFLVIVVLGAGGAALWLPRSFEGEPRRTLTKFLTRGGVEVELSIFSECENCDAPEYLVVATSRQKSEREVPVARRFNEAERGGVGQRVKELIVFGECSDEVLVYQSAFYSREGGDAVESDMLLRIAIAADGSFKIDGEGLDEEEFSRAWERTDFGLCQALRHEGDF